MICVKRYLSYLLLFLSLLLLSVLSSVACLADEPKQISESDLLTLIGNLQQLKVIYANKSALINDLKQISTEQQKEILQLKQQLAESGQTIKQLQTDLAISDELKTKAINSYNEASKSYNEYILPLEKAVKRLKWQRNIAIVFGIIMTFIK